MIAIAGSKGGCGTSTVTLGLAEAFARADTPALAVDADRQLPNLHVLAGLDREPTAAALEGGTDVREVAQQHPRQPGVGILPPPKADDRCSFETVLEELDPDGIRTLVDCPSGAGPDLVEPLGLADGVVVVVSPTDRGLEAAETTVEMARRLEVPVYGAIVNRCSTLPERATRWEGVPLLGTVPDRPGPLVDDEVESAFDDVVARLASQSPADRAPPEYAGDRLPLGTEPIDRRLGGGVARGSVVALVADPASQAERLLYRATATRGTLYVSTDRSRETVRRAIDAAAGPGGTPTIRQVTGEDALTVARDLLEKLPRAANVIVDSVDEYERHDRSAYRSFLDALAERMAETGGLAILHCIEEDVPNRPVTLRFADAVFELEAGTRGTGPAVDPRLAVSKYRPDASVPRTVELAEGEPQTALTASESPPEVK